MNQTPSAAQAARQNARHQDGKYAEMPHAEGPLTDPAGTPEWAAGMAPEQVAHFTVWADEFQAATGLRPDQPAQVYETRFGECEEFTPVADGDERGIVGLFNATDRDGNRIEVTAQLAISEDDQGRWWNLYRDQQLVTRPDGTQLYRELGCGNIDQRTWGSEGEAWAALDHATGSLTFDYQHASGHLEVADEDWYQPVNVDVVPGCAECGSPVTVLGDGTSRHSQPGGGIDHDLDADHTAVHDSGYGQL